MGCGSRAGKMEMHSSGKPYISTEDCIGCGMCRKNCAHDAITITNKKAFIDHNKCVGCGRCIGACPRDAVLPASDESNSILNKKMVEYTSAVLHGRPNFHISLVIDVSPFCDCHSENDIPIVPDIGVGSQGRGYVKELFLGSVSHNVSRQAASSVLLVPAKRGQ